MKDLEQYIWNRNRFELINITDESKDFSIYYGPFLFVDQPFENIKQNTILNRKGLH